MSVVKVVQDVSDNGLLAVIYNPQLSPSPSSTLILIIPCEISF
jgi:hypothetical protein